MAVYFKWCFSFKLILILFAIELVRCSPKASEANNNLLISDFESDSLHFAKRFSIASFNDIKALFLFGDKSSTDTSSVFILYRNKKPQLNFKNCYYIKVPVTRVACLSSIYAAMISKLCLDSTVVAIENVDYYSNQHIINGVENGKIIELSKGPEINIEQTLMLNPDLILTFGMGDPRKDIPLKILDSQIPIAVSIDHLEEHPLARAEWIKFVACFFDKQDIADSLFLITEKNYLTLKGLITPTLVKPTVLTEIKYADAWYVPGGNSFMSHLIHDAGGDYIWKSENRAGSIPLSFETVYAKAKDADYWINLFVNINSKEDLISFDQRYKLFKAYQINHLYNNTQITNKHGYSAYWESGIINPDELLADLIKIMHPELMLHYDLKYYKEIK